MKKTRFQFLLVLLLSFPLLAQALETTPKPFVIPELKEWKAGKGEFTPNATSRIVYPKADAELARVAQLFADDYFTMFGTRLAVEEGKAKAGDFSFETKKLKQVGDEGYTIKISDKVTVAANKPVGAYWATRSLLQMAEQTKSHTLPKGDITDFPDSKVRGFMLDCGRKFIPLHFLQDYVKLMSYYKMNTFLIHLNDNGFKQYFGQDWNKTYSAFRLESDTYPGLAAEDGHYTKAEFIDLQILAENVFVEIIPEIDVPAHSLAFAHYKPEIGSKEYGMDHLDLFNPETYKFVDGLFKEYIEGENPVFRSKRVHIGTDEYSNKKKEVVEKFRYFTDHYIKFVEQYGKQACVWGALSHAKGETPVKSENVLMWLWHNPFAQPDDMIEQGYQLVSIPDGLLYIVPNAGYYYDYLNIKHLYKEWIPTMIGKKTFDENNPNILGGMFAVWNDHVGNGISTKDIHHRTLPAMQTLAVKMWTGKNPSVPFEEFDVKRHNISEAPGVNINGKVGEPNTLVYKCNRVKSGDKTELKEIGYNYTVSFDLQGTKEKKGTVLFESQDATFYLSDPIKGMIGYARDGYLNTFKYSVKNNQKVNIKVCGDNVSTSLFVDGKLVEKLEKHVRYYDEGKAKMHYSPTLVFPLEKAGNFKSIITNLEVYNYIK